MYTNDNILYDFENNRSMKSKKKYILSQKYYSILILSTYLVHEKPLLQPVMKAVRPFAAVPPISFHTVTTLVGIWEPYQTVPGLVNIMFRTTNSFTFI